MLWLDLADCRIFGFCIDALNDEDALLLLGLLSFAKHGGYRCVRLDVSEIMLSYVT